MPSTTVGVALKQDDMPLWEEFKKIARRENKQINELMKEILADYVKKHGEGNPSFRLDKWQDQSDFVALPTLGELLTPERLDKLSKADLDLFAKKARARAQEISAAIKRRGLFFEWSVR